MNDTKLTYSMDQISESPYVLGCRKQDKFKVIDIELPADWDFPERLFPENSPIFVNQGTLPTIFMLFSETKQFSEIYFVLLETVRHNKEKEEKLIILNQLQMQLQKYFDELPLDQFKFVKFKLPATLDAPPTPTAPSITPAPPKPQSNGTILKP